MDTQSYIGHKCLHPIVIRDEHGRLYTAPCGKCKACRMAASSTKVMQIEAESIGKRTLFVTLTFDDIWIPHCVVIPNDDDTFNIYDITPRFGHSLTNKQLIAENVSNDYFTNEDSEYILGRLNFSGYGIPYLCRRDIQLHFKRLRKQIYKKYGETVRTFYCGEYGPKHFRPHFHYLLFYENPAIIDEFISEKFLVQQGKDVNRYLLPTWKWGFASAELPRGSVSSYVASYVNSVSTLPKFYTLPCNRTFGRGSNQLGNQIFNTSIQETAQTTDYRTLSACLSVGDNEITVHPWRSYLGQFFPKCVQFSFLDLAGREFLYTIDTRFHEVYPLSRCFTSSAKAKYLMHRIWNFNPLKKKRRDFEYFFIRRLQLIIKRDYYCHAEMYLSKFGVLDFEDYKSKRLLDFLTRIFYTSRKFIDICHKANLSQIDFIRNLDLFYKSLQQDQLKSWYTLQEKFYTEENSYMFYDVMYNELVNPTVENFCSRKNVLISKGDREFFLQNYLRNDNICYYRSYVHFKYANKQKHKKQNDTFNILKHSIYE